MPTRSTDPFIKPNPRIPVDLVKKLRKIAEEERRSLNDQIIVALDWFVKHRDQEKPR